MVLETAVDAELALLRRLRARRSEKENAYESPSAKLRSSTATSATTTTTRSSGAATAASSSPLTLMRPTTRSSFTSMEKPQRPALPSSVNTQRASSPGPPPTPLLSTATTRASTIGLVRPVEKTARQRERLVDSNKKQQEEQPQRQLTQHKPQQLAQVPERIFECVLDDDGCVTTRCFIKGKFLGKVRSIHCHCVGVLLVSSYSNIAYASYSCICAYRVALRAATR